MRRVARDGSSQYFINQSACRLTDVVELMARVGLGKELHSIIGQGKVESFLAGKPEDRRSQIEEAAGLGTYKRRRERAELKLREVRRNLERAELLEREVGSQLAPLRRQANAAEQLRAVETRPWPRRAAAFWPASSRRSTPSCTARRASWPLSRRRGPLRGGLEELAQRGPAKKSRSRAASRSASGAPSVCCARACSTGASRAVAGLPSSACGSLEEVERSARPSANGCWPSSPARPEEPDDETWPRRGAPLADELAAAEAAHAAVAGALERGREALAERRTALTRARRRARKAPRRAARLERRAEALAGEEERVAAQQAALLRGGGGEGGSRAQAAAAAAAPGARARGGDGRRAARAAGGGGRGPSPRRKSATVTASTASGAPSRRRPTHLRAALRDLEDVGDDVLEVAGEYPGTVSLAGAVSCEAGYERALAAALAQVSGALAVPAASTTGRCSTRSSSAGIGLVRLVVPARRRRPPSVSRARRRSLDKVSLGEHDELGERAGRCGDRRRPARGAGRVPGLAVTREGEFYRPATGRSALPAACRRRCCWSAGRRWRRLAREARRRAGARDARGGRRSPSRAGARRRRARRARGRGTPSVRLASRAETAERDLAAVRGAPPRPRGAPAARPARPRGHRRRTGRGGRGKEAARRSRGRGAARRPSSSGRPAPPPRRTSRRRTAHAGLAGAGHAPARRARGAPRGGAAGAPPARGARAGVPPPIASGSRSSTGGWRSCPPCARPARRWPTRDRALRRTRRAHRAARRRRRRRRRAGARRAAQARRGRGRAAPRARGGRRAAHRGAGGARPSRRPPRRARRRPRRGERAARPGGVRAAGRRGRGGAQLRERVERLSRRRERIGPVNPLAEAECAELGERAAFLREQRRDLEKSIDDLEALIKELTAQVDAEFAAHVRRRAGAVRPHGDGAVPGRPRQPEARRARRGATRRAGWPWRSSPPRSWASACSCSPAASARWWPSPSSWRWCWRGRVRSTSSTRSRRPWTTSTSAAWCSCCATTASARSS